LAGFFFPPRRLVFFASGHRSFFLKTLNTGGFFFAAPLFFLLLVPSSCAIQRRSFFILIATFCRFFLEIISVFPSERYFPKFVLYFPSSPLTAVVIQVSPWSLELVVAAPKKFWLKNCVTANPSFPLVPVSLFPPFFCPPPSSEQESI